MTTTAISAIRTRIAWIGVMSFSKPKRFSSSLRTSSGHTSGSSTGTGETPMVSLLGSLALGSKVVLASHQDSASGQCGVPLPRRALGVEELAFDHVQPRLDPVRPVNEEAPGGALELQSLESVRGVLAHGSHPIGRPRKSHEITLDKLGDAVFFGRGNDGVGLRQRLREGAPGGHRQAA